MIKLIRYIDVVGDERLIDTSNEIFWTLQDIVSYQGYEEELLELKKLLEQWLERMKNEKDSFPCPYHDPHTQFHMFWMLIVGLFGDWGTSIRFGWIYYENIPYAIEFINRLIER